MAHLKRQKSPKNWPIPRKGTAFVVRPNFSPKTGVPILIILRDMLKICQNRKEVKSAIHDKNILLNNKPVTDDKNSAVLFDVLTVVPAKKHYQVELEKNGKFRMQEIKESEAGKKISRIIDKKILKGKKTQLNLSDGRNFISDTKCKVQDSVLIDFKKNKIEKVLPLKEKANAFIFSGKHAGKRGVIEKIKAERKMVKINADGKEINVLIKQTIVIE